MGAIFRDSYRSPRAVSDSLCDQKRKVFHANDKKVGRYRVSLPDTLTRIEKSCRVTINENRHRGRVDARHNQSNKLGGGGLKKLRAALMKDHSNLSKAFFIFILRMK